MPRATRVGADTVGGGTVQTTPQTFVRVDGALLAVEGAMVQSHDSGPHVAATLPTGSVFVAVNGLGVIFAGSVATCGHVAKGSGPLGVAL